MNRPIKSRPHYLRVDSVQAVYMAVFGRVVRIRGGDFGSDCGSRRSRDKISDMVRQNTMLRLLTRPLIKPPSISTTLRQPCRKMATITTPEYVCVSILCLAAFLTDFDNRTRFCTNHWQKLILKSRTSLTRRHGGSSLVWNSSHQRFEYVVPNFHCHLIIPVELDESGHYGSQWLHFD